MTIIRALPPQLSSCIEQQCILVGAQIEDVRALARGAVSTPVNRLHALEG